MGKQLYHKRQTIFSMAEDSLENKLRILRNIAAKLKDPKKIRATSPSMLLIYQLRLKAMTIGFLTSDEYPQYHSNVCQITTSLPNTIVPSPEENKIIDKFKSAIDYLKNGDKLMGFISLDEGDQHLFRLKNRRFRLY